MSPSLSLNSTSLDEGMMYFIGSWRRCPFNASIMPQALNVDEQTFRLVLDSFDSEFNNLWRFHGTEQGIVIELANPSEALVARLHAQTASLFITASLSLSTEKQEAALFELAAYPPFRAGPADVSFQLFCNGLVMGSDERSGSVFLEDPTVAESANPVLNIAWEATPDSDEAVPGDIADVPEWLQDMLLA